MTTKSILILGLIAFVSALMVSGLLMLINTGKTTFIVHGVMVGFMTLPSIVGFIFFRSFLSKQSLAPHIFFWVLFAAILAFYALIFKQPFAQQLDAAQRLFIEHLAYSAIAGILLSYTILVTCSGSKITKGNA